MSTFFFFNDTATTEIYTLSLHDALPICHDRRDRVDQLGEAGGLDAVGMVQQGDAKAAERQCILHVVLFLQDRRSDRPSFLHAVELLAAGGGTRISPQPRPHNPPSRGATCSARTSAGSTPHAEVLPHN